MESIVQSNKDICFICKKYGATDIHHVFNGANKKRSEEDGMLLFLHRCCHRWLHDHPTSNRTIKKRCQMVWMRHYGTEDDFIKRYGKSYLYEIECNNTKPKGDK